MLKIQYQCPKCEHEWEDMWESACDSDCPNCDMKDITALGWDPIPEKLSVGDRVVKNEEYWEESEFDEWGAGEGVGEVIEPPFDLEEGYYDIKWPSGKCFKKAIELQKYTPEKYFHICIDYHETITTSQYMIVNADTIEEAISIAKADGTNYDFIEGIVYDNQKEDNPIKSVRNEVSTSSDNYYDTSVDEHECYEVDSKDYTKQVSKSLADQEKASRKGYQGPVENI